MFQYRIARFNLSGDIGLPLAHPLYIVLAKLLYFFPLGRPEFRANAFSCVCGATTIALMVNLLHSQTRCVWASLLGAMSLALSHTFWTHSVIAEVYNLYTVGLFAELCLVGKFVRTREAKWLMIAAIVNGLNLSNHLMAILHWPAYAGLLYWATRRRILKPTHFVALMAALWVGSSLYVYLISLELAHGRPTLEVLKEALVGPPSRAKHVLEYSFPWGKQTKNSILYFALNFPTPLLLLAPVGMVTAYRMQNQRWLSWIAGGIFAVSFIFAFRYTVPDQFAFFTPCYSLVAMFIGLGAANFIKHKPSWRIACLLLAILPAAVYELAPGILRTRKTSIGLSRELAYRDNYDYFIRPRKNGYKGTERFVREALNMAAPDGLIYADTTVINPLIYARDIWHVDPNVVLLGVGDIISDPPRIDSSISAVQPYVNRMAAWSVVPNSDYMPKWLISRYETVRDGILFRLVSKSPDSAH